MESVDLKTIPSIEEKCAFVRDVASRGGEADVETAVVGDDWVFERMVSASKHAACKVRGN